MLILHNGKIYGSKPFQHFSEAIAIHENKIIAVGKNSDILSLSDRKSKVIDLHGKSILPGLTDSHLHLLHLAESLSKVNCDTKNIHECYNHLESRICSSNSEEWILGHGWDQNAWAGGFDDLNTLKNLPGQNPIYLTAKSLHAAWANQKALEFAGIDRDTPDPENGRIERDAAGNPTGLLIETAKRLLDDCLPLMSNINRLKALELTQQELWKVGLTAVHDFDRSDCFFSLQQLDIEKKLRLRVVKGVHLAGLDDVLQTGLRSNFGSDYLHLGAVKLFADGALGPRTAAMISPYENDPNNFGTLMLSEEEIIQTGIKAAQNGFPLAIHAIGDQANHVVISGYKKLREYETQQKIPHLKHRIEHVQILSPGDVAELANNKIVASMQPIHLILDMDTADRHWGDRSKFAYAFRSLLSYNTQLIFGSDAPVESYNPFLGVYAALTRQKYGQINSVSWYPQEKITFPEILSAYTINPANAANWDSEIGSLEPGKYADLTVFPKDPLLLDPAELLHLSPLATMVSGEWVWNGEVFR